MASGRRWAYVGTVFGVTMSAAANWLGTLTNDNVPPAYRFIAAGFMALLPVGLFISLEVLVRNPIKAYIWWWRGGMFTTAVAFAVPSYLHMNALALFLGQGPVIATVVPVGFDGMMLLSTLSLLMPSGEFVQPEPVELPVMPVVRPAVAAASTPRTVSVTEPSALELEWRRTRFSPEELAEREGKGINSARSKIGRWKRAEEFGEQ